MPAFQAKFIHVHVVLNFFIEFRDDAAGNAKYDYKAKSPEPPQACLQVSDPPVFQLQVTTL